MQMNPWYIKLPEVHNKSADIKIENTLLLLLFTHLVF